MKFKYKRYSPEIVRPVIPIQVCYGQKSVTYEVLVDSGADCCIFDSQIGEILDINIASGRANKVCGITGEAPRPYPALSIVALARRKSWVERNPAPPAIHPRPYGRGVLVGRGKTEIYYSHNVLIKIGDKSFETAVGFLTGIAPLGYGVVGQKGFFDHMTIKFDLPNEDIELIAQH